MQVGGGGGWLSDPSVAMGLGPEWQERARVEAAREQRAMEAEEA